MGVKQGCAGNEVVCWTALVCLLLGCKLSTCKASGGAWLLWQGFSAWLWTAISQTEAFTLCCSGSSLLFRYHEEDTQDQLWRTSRAPELSRLQHWAGHIWKVLRWKRHCVSARDVSVKFQTGHPNQTDTLQHFSVEGSANSPKEQCGRTQYLCCANTSREHYGNVHEHRNNLYICSTAIFASVTRIWGQTWK